MPSAQPVAVSVAFSTPQTTVLLEVIAGANGAGRVVIVTVLEFALFPQIFSQYALYVPDPTVIVEVVAPVLHFNVPMAQALAVNVTVSGPQTVPPPVIVGAVGVGIFCIVIDCELPLVPHSVVHFAL